MILFFDFKIRSPSSNSFQKDREGQTRGERILVALPDSYNATIFGRPICSESFGRV